MKNRLSTLIKGFCFLFALWLTLLIGLQVGKKTERDRLKELELYPTNEQIFHAELKRYGGM